MSTAPISKIYNINYFAFQKNIAGITHQESMIQPHESTSSINWIMGHLVLVRDEVLKLLQEEILCDEGCREIYGAGTAGLVDVRAAIDLPELVNAFQHSQEIINEKLQLFEKETPRNVDELMVQLAGFGFHDAYHIGQLGYIRRLLNKPSLLG